MLNFFARLAQRRQARRDARLAEYHSIVADFASLVDLDPDRVHRILYVNGKTALNLIVDATEHVRRRRMQAGDASDDWPDGCPEIGDRESFGDAEGSRLTDTLHHPRSPG